MVGDSFMSKRPEIAKTFRRSPIRSWNDINPMFGNVFNSLDGQVIQRGGKLGNALRLPNVLDSTKTTVGDLIPSTSWGSSLAQLLTKKSWDGYRLPLIAANHAICQLCGAAPNRSLDVHEVWSYSYPSEDLMARRKKEIIFGVQTLEGLMGLCHECHECFHLGYANKIGRLPIALDRLAALNGWSKDQVLEYYEFIFKRWHFNSEFFWALDIAKLPHPDGGLTIKNGWVIHPEDSRFLMHPSQHGGGDNISALVNAPWRYQKETVWRKPESLSEKKLDSESGGVINY